MIEFRVCNKCKLAKDVDVDFYLDKNRPGGRAYTCKVCVKGLVSAWSKTERGKERARIAKRKFEKSPHGRLHRLKYQNTPEQKEKARLRAKARLSTPEGKKKQFQDWLKRHYGMSVSDWENKLQLQGNKCAACKKTELFRDRNTHVDHNHATKQIRGLLCRGCNVAIGFAKEDTQRLLALVDYLNQYR